MGIAKTQIVKYIRKGDKGDTGNPGAKGDKGAALRGPQAWADCANAYAFKSGGASEDWIDVVLYNSNYYVCKKSHSKSSSNYPGSSADVANGYWQLGDRIELVATKILLAQYALVKNLGVEAIEMRDANNNILFEAKNGNVTCKTGTFENIKIKGSIRNPFANVDDSFDSDYSDNVVMLSQGGGWIYSYSLPWDTSQSGRRIVIINYRWGGSYASGQASVSAPSGKYFYENGISTSELKISREIIELIGYGTPTQFYGWVVMNRNNLMTTKRYGRELRVLAYGTVTGTSSGASISYKSFDGNNMYVTRASEGMYTISYSADWFSDASSVRAIVNGVGYVAGSSISPTKATIISRNTNYIVVAVSDDETRNDGSFDFLLYNGNDWIV